MPTRYPSTPRLERTVVALESVVVNSSQERIRLLQCRLSNPNQAHHLSQPTKEISPLSLPEIPIPSASSLISPSPVNLVFILFLFTSTDHVDIGSHEGVDLVAKLGMLISLLLLAGEAPISKILGR